MAQRRSKNRRLSSRRLSNVSDILDENTNFIDNDDPRWYDRSAIRPSTSLALTTRASSVLNPDSTLNASQLSDRWFNDLTKSDSSKLTEEAVKKNVNHQQEQHESSHGEPCTESESDHESHKRRAKFRFNQKNINKSDKSNVFLKALEKTTDSHTRNLTNVQVFEGNDTESTNDESRTIKKFRSRPFKVNKHSKVEASNYDDIFHSDTASERIENDSNNSKSSRIQSEKQRNSLDKTVTSDSITNKQTNENIINKSVNKSKDITITQSSSRELSKRSIPGMAVTKIPDKSPRITQLSSEVTANNTNSSIESERRKQSALFSQDHKNRTNENLFDDVFESNNDEQNADTENGEEEEMVDTSNDIRGNLPEAIEKNRQEDGNESESSSIPKNIKRTRSRSLYMNRQSQNKLDNEDINVSTNKTGTQEVEDSKQQSMKRGSQINQSKNLSKSQNKTMNKSTVSQKNKNSLYEKGNENEGRSKFVRDSISKSLENEESSDENIFDGSLTKNKNLKDNESENSKRQLRKSSSQINRSRNLSKSHSQINRSRNLSNSQNKTMNKTTVSQNDKSSADEKGNYDSDASSEIYDGPKSKLLEVEESSDEDIVGPLIKSKNMKGNESENSKRQLRKRSSLINRSRNLSKSHSQINRSRNLSKSQNKTMNKTSVSQNDKSSADEKGSDSDASSEIYDGSKSKLLEVEESSDDENIFNRILTNNKSTKNDEGNTSQGQSPKQRLSQALKEPLNTSKSVNKSANIQIGRTSTRRSKSALNVNDDEEQSKNDQGKTPSPVITGKRSHLFKRKKASEDRNVFDEVFRTENSTLNQKSKIDDAPNTSLRIKSIKHLKDSRNISKSINTSPKKPLSDVSAANISTMHNNSKDDSRRKENESESSTIPKYIRRTRSRLFHKSDAPDDDNVFDEVLETENFTAKESPRKDISSTNDSLIVNRSFNKNILAIAASKKPRVLLERVSSKQVVHESSSESHKENQSINQERSRFEISQTNSFASRMNQSLEKSKKSNVENVNSIERNKSVSRSLKMSIAERYATNVVAKNDLSTVNVSEIGSPNKSNVSITEKVSITAQRTWSETSSVEMPHSGSVNKLKMSTVKKNATNDIAKSHVSAVNVSQRGSPNKSKVSIAEKVSRTAERNQSDESSVEMSHNSSVDKLKTSTVEKNATNDRVKSHVSAMNVSQRGSSNKSVMATTERISRTAERNRDDESSVEMSHSSSANILKTSTAEKNLTNNRGKSSVSIVNMSSRNTVNKSTASIAKRDERMVEPTKSDVSSVETSHSGSVNNLKTSNVEKEPTRKRSKSVESSVETSNDGSPEPKNKKSQPVHETFLNNDNLSDDLLHTPNPAQSTLNQFGKPLTRITQFSFRNHSFIDEVPSPVPASTAPVVENIGKHRDQRGRDKANDNEEVEEEEVDVMNTSDVSENPLMTRDPKDIPKDSEMERSTHVNEAMPISHFLRSPKSQSASQAVGKSTIDESVWTEVKKKVDAFKLLMLERMKREAERKREEEKKKARLEQKLKRVMAQKEAERKKKQRKPIDKAYYVNGELYKQPKLPRPKPWVTDRLYKYLWKCMEPKYGMRTRVKSEKFVLKLSAIFTVITKRTKYENYEAELDDLLVTMAKLNIIECRADFYRFCSDYMPYKFRIKVVPIAVPRKGTIIPFDPDKVYEPILTKRSRRGIVSDSESCSGNENNESDEER